MGWRSDAPALILCGGPSIKGVDVAELEGRGNVIAVNLACRLAPFADVLYFADRRFFYANRDELQKHGAPLKVMRSAPDAAFEIPGLVVKLYNGRGALSCDHSQLCGLDGGANAINLAFQMGAKRIIVFGLDMKPEGNWHEPHPFKPTPAFVYKQSYIPGHRAMAAELAKRGVSVLNCSGNSALDCYPKVTFSEVIDLCPLLVSSPARARKAATASMWRGLPPSAIV
jgi:hypothetical protein